MAPLLKDLPELVAHNIISPQTATNIQKYYAARKQPQANTMLTIFGAFGGLLVGLGIILIFAHNWDTFSKGVKTGLAIVPLVLFQAFAAYTIIKDKSSAWKEAAALLVFCMVGASISLVAQVYNISGDLPAFLQTWIMLTIPLIYLLKSNALTVVLIIFSTWYAAEAGYFREGLPYSYILFMAALMPYYLNYLRKNANSRMAFILNWLMPLSALIAFGAFLDGADQFTFILYTAFICLLYNIGSLPYFNGLQFKRTGYLVMGELGSITLLLVGSFRWVWTELIGNNTPHVFFTIIWIVLLLVNAGLMVWHKSTRFSNSLKWVTLIFPVLYFAAQVNIPLATILANLAVLGFGVLTISNGINKLEFRTLNFGLLILAVLTTCRFFDTNISFVIRGLMFLIVGIGFFVANYIVIKKKKDTPNTPQHEN
jgi:uncharacterized membrane protein